MKPLTFLLGASLFATATVSRADSDLSPIGFLPGFKSGVSVDANERNPYAEREKKNNLATEDEDSEAARIREKLQGLRVRGTGTGPRGRRVLFGDLVLMQGKELPPLIPGQMDRLICTRVTENEVEISWLTESGDQVADGRRLLITIDQEVIVRYYLPGQLNSDTKETDFRRGSLKNADVRPIGVAAPAPQTQP